MPPDCQRCGTELNSFGRCQDETCPFSDCAQDDSGGWEGFPHNPDPRPKLMEPADSMRFAGTEDVEIERVLRGQPRDDVLVDLGRRMRERTFEGPVAHVTQEFADAFNMHDLPNVVVGGEERTTRATAVEIQEGRVVDIAAELAEAEDALNLAAADCGWNDRSRISVLLDFIAQRGLGEVFADYVNKRADEECRS